MHSASILHSLVEEAEGCVHGSVVYYFEFEYC